MNRYYWPFLAALAWFYSANTTALEFNCKVPGDERFLRLEIPGQEHLCEVTVTRQTGERQVKWYANHDTKFCTTKAYELSEKYVNEWNFNCEKWPDLDGIDALSDRHRTILDAELKRMIETGKASEPAFTVESVRATANAASDTSPSSLALQYFLSTGDTTQFIVDDGQVWEVMVKIDELALQVESDVKITAALVEAITDSGDLQIITVVENDSTNDNCFGSQVLAAKTRSELVARTPHRYTCKP